MIRSNIVGTMNCCLLVHSSVAVGVADATIPLADVITYLYHADQILLWTGLALTLGIAVRWVLQGRRDPLTDGPVRSTSLAPELLLLPVVMFLLVVAAASPLVLRLAEGYAEGAARLTAGNVGMICAAAVCMAIGRFHFRGGLRGFLFGETPAARQVLLAFVLLLVSLPTCYLALEGAEWALQQWRPDYPAPEHPVIDALRDPDEPPWAPLVLWMGAVVVAPVTEECFFRGLLQTVILVLSGRRWLAVGVTAVVFGVAHATQPQVVPALIVLGLLLGYAYERSGGLLAPFLLHMLFNLKTMTWEFYGAGGS
jgi:membrane protease YdiL (CAAX protease family)